MKFPCGNEDHRISTIIQIYIHFRATLPIPGDSMHCTRGGLEPTGSKNAEVWTWTFWSMASQFDF